MSNDNNANPNAPQAPQQVAPVSATLQRIRGTDTVELIPGDPSTRTHIQLAINQGLVEAVGPGLYRDIPRGTYSAQQSWDPQAPEHQPAPPEVNPGLIQYSPEDQRTIDDIEASMDPSLYSTLQAKAITGVLEADGNFTKLQRELMSYGFPPSEAAQVAPKLVGVYQTAIVQKLAEVNLEGDRVHEFFDHMRNDPRRLQDALQKVVYGGDASGFLHAAREWKFSNPVDTSHLKAEGFEVAMDPDTGDPLVRHPGMGQDWMEYHLLMRVMADEKKKEQAKR